jgi:hypothetical protein
MSPDVIMPRHVALKRRTAYVWLPGLALLAMLGSALAVYFGSREDAKVASAELQQQIQAAGQQHRDIKAQLDAHLANAVDKRDYDRTMEVLRGEMSKYVTEAEFQQFVAADQRWKQDITATLRDIQNGLRRSQ